MADVLLVEDDLDSADAVARILSRAGHSVRGAPNGREAVAALTTQTPDVVILDYKMPEMDGVSFLEVIRCYLRWQKLPVILLTGYREGTHIRRAAELGVRTTFLKGDYDPDVLLAYVDSCVMSPIVPEPPPSHPGLFN